MNRDGELVEWATLRPGSEYLSTRLGGDVKARATAWAMGGADVLALDPTPQNSRPPVTPDRAAAVEGSLSGQTATKPEGGAGVPPVSAPPTRKDKPKRTTYREAGISGPVEVEAKP